MLFRSRFVAPTTASMTAALDDMAPSSVDERVLQPVKGVTDPDAYPLTHLTYAVTTPGNLAPDEAGAYAKFLDYVAGPGQHPGLAPGDLPAGYVPLPKTLRTQTLATAAEIAKAAVVTPTPSASPSASTPPDTGPGATASGVPPAGVPGADPDAPGAIPPSTGPSAAPTTGPAVIAASATTPSSAAGSSRYGVAALLFLTAVVLLLRELPVIRPRRGP